MPDHERVAKEIAAYVASWKGTSCDDPGIHVYAITEILRHEYGDARRDALEEAAMTAEDYSKGHLVGANIAIAIRKLKEETDDKDV